MTNVVVTGGAGFIGSNLTRKLLEDYDDVRVIDDYFLGDAQNLPMNHDDLTVVKGDVRYESDIEKVIDDETEAVFHQAARSSAPHHNRNPKEGLDVNVGGFVNMLEVARRHNVDNIIYASTSSMYGSVSPPHGEQIGEEPTNIYSASKMSRENYATAYRKKYDMTIIGLRYFSVYGPREKPKGEYANLITQFLWDMMTGQAPVIYGDGSQTRDFTHVADIVRGNLAAMEKENPEYDFYNLGTGRETTVNEMVEILNEKLGTDIEPEYVENPLDNYVHRTKADISRAKEDLGWEPQVSLEEGISRQVEYYTS